MRRWFIVSFDEAGFDYCRAEIKRTDDRCQKFRRVFMISCQFSVWDIELKRTNSRVAFEFHSHHLLLRGTIHFGDMENCFIKHGDHESNEKIVNSELKTCCLLVVGLITIGITTSAVEVSQDPDKIKLLLPEPFSC